jgi:hypothetical protein
VCLRCSYKTTGFCCCFFFGRILYTFCGVRLLLFKCIRHR